MRKARGVVVLIFIWSTNLFAQDIHFTQIKNTPIVNNPAATGLFDGWERISINHKNQWVNAGTSFFTSSIAADLNVLKKKEKESAHIGLGLQLFRDIGGDSRFGTKEVLFNVSSIVPLSSKQLFSAGLQIGFGQKSGDLSAVTFSNQFDGIRIDPTENSMEGNNLVSTFFSDFSVGALYNFKDSKSSISRNIKTDFKVGLAYFHFNRPSLRFRNGGTERLFPKWVGNISFLKDFSASNGGIEVYFNQSIQGPFTESLLGLLYRYGIKTGSKSTGLKRDTYVLFGASYRFGDAFSPIVYLEHNSFTFGVSYDVTTSQFAQASGAGGLEFSFTYANLDFALFKRRRF